jgi:hypothetical protein
VQGLSGVSKQSTLSQGLIKSGISGSVKIVPIPLKRNKILFRLENLDDTESFFVNSTLVVQSFWSAANNLDLPPFKLTETSVTGNMDLEEMQSRRLKWQTAVPKKSKITFE